MNTKTITVGLLWHSLSSDNFGVGALTESQIAICQSAAALSNVEVKFRIFGFIGNQSYKSAFSNAVVSETRVSLRDLFYGRSVFLQEVKECDIVLDIGEGDSFADIYGQTRFAFSLISKAVVLYCRKPLILSPQTIGPFNSTISRWLASWVMRRCRKVFSRDVYSTEYLKTCGVTENIAEAIDVAFRLPFNRPSPGIASHRRIGINVSGLLYSGGYHGGNQFNLSVDYKLLIQRLIKHWTADQSNEVWLFPHVLSDNIPNEDDRSAIAGLAKEFGSLNIVESFNAPSDAKSFIASMDFVTGARMHACIAAFSSGVAVVPLAYSRKFSGLFNTLGYKQVADGQSMSTDEAFDCICNGFENRLQLKDQIANGNLIADERLDRYVRFLSSELLRISEPS
jgi:colanic acid/amylovoran biosynthesis protein